MLQRVARPAGRNRHPNAVRDQRQHMRGPLHKLLHIRHPGQRVLNNALVLARQVRLAAQLLNVIAVSLRSGHAPGRSVRLLQKPRVGQVGHHVANGRGTQPFAAGARNGARAHGFSAGNKGLDNRGQDFAFPSARWSWWHMFPRCNIPESASKSRGCPS